MKEEKQQKWRNYRKYFIMSFIIYVVINNFAWLPLQLLGDNDYRNKKYDSASKWYNMAIAKKGGNQARLHEKRGKAYLNSGEYEKALEDFKFYKEEVKYEEKHRPDVLLGELYKAQGKYNEAIIYYMKALTKNNISAEELAEIFRSRKECFEKIGSTERAKSDEVSKKFFSGDRVTINKYKDLLNKAINYNNDKEFDKAIEYTDKAHEIYSEWRLGYLQLGRAYFGKKEYLRSEEIFKRVIIINREDYEGYYRLGLVYNHLGKYDLERDNLNKAINRNEKDFLTRFNLVINYLNMDDIANAKQLFLELKEKFPDEKHLEDLKKIISDWEEEKNEQ